MSSGGPELTQKLTYFLDKKNDANSPSKTALPNSSSSPFSSSPPLKIRSAKTTSAPQVTGTPNNSPVKASHLGVKK